MAKTCRGRRYLQKKISRPLLRRVRRVYHSKRFNWWKMRYSFKRAGNGGRIKLFFQTFKVFWKNRRADKIRQIKNRSRRPKEWNFVFNFGRTGRRQFFPSRQGLAVGNSGSRRRSANDVRLVRRFGKLYFRRRIRRRRRAIWKILAGWYSLHRQRHFTVSRRHLAGDAFIGWFIFAENDFCSRIHHFRRA